MSEPVTTHRSISLMTPRKQKSKVWADVRWLLKWVGLLTVAAVIITVFGLWRITAIVIFICMIGWWLRELIVDAVAEGVRKGRK